MPILPINNNKNQTVTLFLSSTWQDFFGLIQPNVHRPSLPRVPIRLVSRGKKARANTRPESPLTNESNLLPDKSSPLRIHPLASLPLFSRLCCSSLCRLNITHSSPYLGFHLPLHCLLLQGFLFFPSSPHRSSLGPPPGGSPVRSPSPPKSGAWRSWSRTRKPAWRQWLPVPARGQRRVRGSIAPTRFWMRGLRKVDVM